jgi:hypothetical protein
VRKAFEDGVKDSENRNSVNAIGNWMCGTDKMSLKHISEIFQALEGSMEKAIELIPELLRAQGDAPAADVFAQILFSGTLVSHRSTGSHKRCPNCGIFGTISNL